MVWKWIITPRYAIYKWIITHLLSIDPHFPTGHPMPGLKPKQQHLKPRRVPFFHLGNNLPKISENTQTKWKVLPSLKLT